MKSSYECISFLLVAIGVTMASVSLFYQYSYWWDELYSVAGASLPMEEMFRYLVFPDVHPPLYQMFLNMWVSIFGSDERVVRSLSFLFSVLSLFVVWMWSRNNLKCISKQAAVIFFSTCSLFPFYAQEARSYAMLLLLSTIVTVTYLGRWHLGEWRKVWFFFSVIILLSLTHYFGFIYSGIIVMASLYEARRDFYKSTIAFLSGVLCFVWPVIHFSNGGVGGELGGNFWIKSEGFQSTIYQLSSGVTPQLNFISKMFPAGVGEYFTTFLFILFLLVVLFFSWVSERAFVDDIAGKREVWRKCAIVFVSFVFVVSAIDYHSPISTRRNFIVLLPIVSILFGCAALGLKKSGFKYAFFLVVVGGLANLGTSLVSVESKVSPEQNHSEAASFIEDNIRNESVYYLSRGRRMSEIHKMMAEFYFSDEIYLRPVVYENLHHLEGGFYVFMQHQKYDLGEILSDFSDNDVAVDFYVPQRNDSVVVVYSD